MKSKSILSIISKVSFAFAVIAFACCFFCLVLSAFMPGIAPVAMPVSLFGLTASLVFFTIGMETMPSDCE